MSRLTFLTNSHFAMRPEDAVLERMKRKLLRKEEKEIGHRQDDGRVGFVVLCGELHYRPLPNPNALPSLKTAPPSHCPFSSCTTVPPSLSASLPFPSAIGQSTDPPRSIDPPPSPPNIVRRSSSSWLPSTTTTTTTEIQPAVACSSIPPPTCGGRG